MAVPKTTETRCRDGSVQARHGIQRLQNKKHVTYLPRVLFRSDM